MMDISLEINKNINGRSGSVVIRNSAGAEIPHNDNTLTACLNRYVFRQVFVVILRTYIFFVARPTPIPVNSLIHYIYKFASDSIHPMYLTNHVLL